jgi:SOS response regulatory protein OraA/RecX
VRGGAESGSEGAHEIAISALARRDLSEAALRARLRSAGIGHDVEEETLAALRRAGLVNDARLCQARAQKLAGQGYGNSVIEARLDHEGLQRSEVTSALAELPPEEVRAQALAREEEPRRLADLLFRRGFGEDAIESALAHLDAVPETELP